MVRKASMEGLSDSFILRGQTFVKRKANFFNATRILELVAVVVGNVKDIRHLINVS
jgi:hypothetical protein